MQFNWRYNSVVIIDLQQKGRSRSYGFGMSYNRNVERFRQTVMQKSNTLKIIYLISNASAHHVAVISGKPEVHPIISQW